MRLAADTQEFFKRNNKTMANDPFANWITPLTGPATDAEEITPHNTNELTDYCRALWIGTGGSLRVTTLGDTVLNSRISPAGCGWIFG